MASAPRKSPPFVQRTVVEPALEALPASAEDVVAAPQEAMAETQQSLRSAMEKGVVETRAAYAKVKVAADETANAFESSFAAAKEGIVAINARALEALRVNIEANFDFVKAAFDVKSLGDWATLQSDFARKQVEAMTGQTKEIGALAQKTMTDASAPIKDRFARAFKIAG